MHKFAEEIAECLKAKVKAVGIDNIEGCDLEEVKAWSEIVKNLVCYDKDFKIVEAMEEENDSEKSMEMYRRYSEDDFPKRYYDHYRYKNGHFAPKGSGAYHRYYDDGLEMNAHDYRMWSDRNEQERMRDVDRYYGGRMYYSGRIEPRYYDDAMTRAASNYRSDDNSRDYREGMSGMRRKYYMESKENGEDKSKKMQKLDEYLEELKTDMKDVVKNMTPEEKSMWQQRLTNMASTM